jgi:hypothetical protein
MVHGFDVSLGKSLAFERLVKRCRSLLDSFGVQLITIRTNLREVTRPKWEDAFAAQLACCLHQLDFIVDGGIIGSSEPYNHLVFPWGSTPATDHLLSGGMFWIFHDGAAHSRTVKLEALLAFPEALRALKFCFAGPNPEENCGVCEKCLRTYLNFCAVGIERPECMPVPSLQQLANIPLPSQIHANEIRQALDYAKRHGRTGPWLQAAEQSLASFDKTLRAASVRSAIRSIPYVGPFLRAANRSWRTFRL